MEGAASAARAAAAGFSVPAARPIDKERFGLVFVGWLICSSPAIASLLSVGVPAIIVCFEREESMWKGKAWKQVAHLKDQYRCVTTTLPGFSGEDAGTTNPWGYRFDDVAKRLERTIEAVANGKPVILVSHDWGCVYAYMLEKNRPDLVQKMVAIDVGGGIWWWPSFSLLLIVTYQTYIITAFLIGGSIGNTISRLLSWWAGAPPASNVARASVGYPYWHFWKAQISSCFGLGPFTPQCPVLFMYGTTGFKKFMTFHDDEWVGKIRRKKGSSVVEVTGASHWVMVDKPDVVNGRLDTFFAED